MKLPSINSVKRHITKNTSETQEGKIMTQSLLTYLNEHQYPLIVSLSEDGTAVTPAIEYDQRSDSLRGLVAPFDIHGMPSKDVFKARSLTKMVNDMKTYHVGEYLYVIMALPMAVDVISRWGFVEAELAEVGIKVFSISSDGDPRLLKAMKERSGIPSPFASTVYGPYFAADLTDEPVLIQDPVHLINKLRNPLLDPQRHMRLGQFVVSVAVIHEMVQQGCKGIHKLNLSDLNPNDRMKFDPSLKLMATDLIQHLKDTVAGSSGTPTS